MSSRDSYLLRTYGITEAEYDDLLDAQGGRCAICRKPPKTKSLAVDHDHRTGRIRGLLCSFCNYNLLGRRDRDVHLFLRAYEYLTEPPCDQALGERVVPVRSAPKKRRRKVRVT